MDRKVEVYRYIGMCVGGDVTDLRGAEEEDVEAKIVLVPVEPERGPGQVPRDGEAAGGLLCV